MLATISPANTHVDETLATLRYACQARSIVNRARVNENPHDRLIRELKAEVERLRALRQDYERQTTSNSSVIYIDDSVEHAEELDNMKQRLLEAEEKLLKAKNEWEQKFLENKLKQQEQLAEAERQKEELESHIRIMSISDTDVSLSPYKSNFLEELTGMLQNEELEEKSSQKMITKNDVTNSINQIYDILTSLRPAIDDAEENVKLLFARTNKLLQAFESSLINSLNKTNTQKTVKFKL